MQPYVMVPPLRIEIVSDPAQLSALARAWDGWVDEHSPGAVFRSAAWITSWWEHLSTGKELRVYTGYRGGELVAVLPAYRSPTPLAGHRLRLIGDDIVASDYLGVIARPFDVNVAAAAMASALILEEHDVALDGVLDDEPLVRSLAVAARAANVSFSCARYQPCPFLAISSAGDYFDWLRGRPGGAGAQFRRRKRWLERRPGFRIDVLTTEDEIVRELPTLWRLHRARWAEWGRAGVVQNLAVKAFHDESARVLARRGWARLYLLHVDGAPRAALYGFERGGRFAYYQSGHDPAYRQRSVGAVLLGVVIEDAFARNLTEFDFLRGREAYKDLFASSHRQLVRVRIASGAAARAMWLTGEVLAAAPSFARTILPPVALAWLRRRQRQLHRWSYRLTNDPQVR